MDFKLPPLLFISINPKEKRNSSNSSHQMSLKWTCDVLPVFLHVAVSQKNRNLQVK